jgi:hypothetical protein
MVDGRTHCQRRRQLKTTINQQRKPKAMNTKNSMKTSTQFKVTLRKRTQGTWDEDYSSGHLGFMAEYFDSKDEAEAESDKRNEKLAQEMADGCGMDVEEWNETRARDCGKYWHVIEA